MLSLHLVVRIPKLKVRIRMVLCDTHSHPRCFEKENRPMLIHKDKVKVKPKRKPVLIFTD